MLVTILLALYVTVALFGFYSIVTEASQDLRWKVISNGQKAMVFGFAFMLSALWIITVPVAIVVWGKDV